jgi:hypothetical protein
MCVSRVCLSCVCLFLCLIYLIYLSIYLTLSLSLPLILDNPGGRNAWLAMLPRPASGLTRSIEGVWLPTRSLSCPPPILRVGASLRRGRVLISQQHWSFVGVGARVGKGLSPAWWQEMYRARRTSKNMLDVERDVLIGTRILPQVKDTV